MIFNKKNSTRKTNTNIAVPFNKKLVAVLISSSLLFACGGSGGGSNPLSINGTASKGIILGGVVTAYLIDSEASDGKGEDVGTAITNTTDGTYELTLDSDYNGEALIIEITAADGSQMKCDLSVCLADEDDEVAITFGELYTLPTDFELSAVSSGTDSGSISINITPLTNIAAALTLDKVSEDGVDPAAAATLSNFEVAQTLGLGNDVTALPIVDLTDADAINAADEDDLLANLKSAAVVEAVLNNSVPGTTLEEALESFADQYVDSGGIAQTGGETVSLEEIAAASNELLSKVADVDDVSNDDVLAAQSTLTAEENAASKGTDEIIVVEIPDDLGSEGLAATKAFVSQVSAFNLAAQLDGDEASFEEEALDGVNAFKDEISLVSDLASSGLDVNAEALSLAAAAIADAVDVVLDSEETITSHIYQSESGIITVTISTNGDTVTYTVDQTLTVANSIGLPEMATIDLTAVLEFSDAIEETETEPEAGPGGRLSYEAPYSYTFTWDVEGEASVDLALSGSVSTDQVSITINDGSHFIATLTVDEEEVRQESGSYTEDDGLDSDTEDRSETASGLISVTGVDIELSATIAQVADGDITDPISFTGDLDIAATLLSVDYDETEIYDYDYIETTNGYTETELETDNGTEVVSVDGFTASLSGTFSNSENSLAATVAIAASGIEETCVWDNEWSGSWASNTESEHSYSENDDCSLTGETTTTYASASINVLLTLAIDGIDDEIELDALIERTGLESGVASIDLTYNGNQLNFDFNTDDIVEEETGSEELREVTTTITATLTNHNGVKLTLTQIQVDEHSEADTNDSKVSTGVISHEGEEFATVSDDGIVTFSDGTFVTL